VRFPSPDELPLSVLTHLFLSRHCQSDRLDRFARRTVDDSPTGYQHVVEARDWIRDNIDTSIMSVMPWMPSPQPMRSSHNGRACAASSLILAIATMPRPWHAGTSHQRLCVASQPPDYHGVFRSLPARAIRLPLICSIQSAWPAPTRLIWNPSRSLTRKCFVTSIDEPATKAARQHAYEPAA